jgi:nucleoside-triphosphatase THEP1
MFKNEGATFLRSLKSEEPVHILITGPPGHAKTLFLKYILETLGSTILLGLFLSIAYEGVRTKSTSKLSRVSALNDKWSRLVD